MGLRVYIIPSYSFVSVSLSYNHCPLFTIFTKMHITFIYHSNQYVYFHILSSAFSFIYVLGAWPSPRVLSMGWQHCHRAMSNQMSYEFSIGTLIWQVSQILGWSNMRRYLAYYAEQGPCGLADRWPFRYSILICRSKIKLQRVHLQARQTGDCTYSSADVISCRQITVTYVSLAMHTT